MYAVVYIKSFTIFIEIESFLSMFLFLFSQKGKLENIFK